MANTGSVAVRKVVGILSVPETGLGIAVKELAEESGVALTGLPPAHIVRSERRRGIEREEPSGEVSGGARVCRSHPE